MTKQAIISANPQGTMTMVSGTNDIAFANGVVLTSATSREKKNLWNKLTRMGFEQVTNTSSDEFDGLVQAAQIGENPFECTIMCANPELNEIAGSKVSKNEPSNIINIPMLNDMDQFDRNRERADNNGNEHCPCCGRDIKSPKYFINSIYGGCMYPANDQQVYADAWVMGVGSECRKKLPQGYVFQITE